MKHNQQNQYDPPLMRSKMRFWLGRWYFTCKRSCQWLKQSSGFARYKDLETFLPHPVSSHETPLFRPLQKVEMWLQHNKVNNLRLGYSRHNMICRRVYDLTGREIDDVFVTENHAVMMYEPMLESPDPHSDIVND